MGRVKVGGTMLEVVVIRRMVLRCVAAAGQRRGINNTPVSVNFDYSRTRRSIVHYASSHSTSPTTRKFTTGMGYGIFEVLQLSE